MKQLWIISLFIIGSVAGAQPVDDRAAMHEQIIGKWECTDIQKPGRSKRAPKNNQLQPSFTIVLDEDYSMKIWKDDALICTTRYNLKNKLGKWFFKMDDCDPVLPLHYRMNDGIIQIDNPELRINCAYNDRGYIYTFTKVNPSPRKRFKWFFWMN